MGDSYVFNNDTSAEDLVAFITEQTYADACLSLFVSAMGDAGVTEDMILGVEKIFGLDSMGFLSLERLRDSGYFTKEQCVRIISSLKASLTHRPDSPKSMEA